MYSDLPTPVVVVELDILERNIRAMINDAARYGLAHRPHIKTHRSSELARLQLAYGARGITCAKLGEAEVMVSAGIDDILIAYPLIGREKLQRYAALAKQCAVRTIINSYEGALGLSQCGQANGQIFEVLLEIDGGVDRGGIKPGLAALEFACSLKGLTGISLVGLLYYPGRNYSETTQEGIERAAGQEREDLLQTKAMLEKAGFQMPVLSGGNTVSGKVPWRLEGLTEIRAGNYIFNDCAQLYTNRVGVEDCALRVVATVVAKPDEYHAILDAGSKSLSSDSFSSTGSTFGHIIGHKDVELYKLNEEHGFIRSPLPLPFKIGDQVVIIPNHCCVVTNLVDELYGMRNGVLERLIRVDARGKSN